MFCREAILYKEQSKEQTWLSFDNMPFKEGFEK